MMKSVKKNVKYFVDQCHRASRIFEKSYLSNLIDLKYPPVFIIGPPRSGSTLLYQIMLNTYKFAYFPNISNTLYMCPVFAAKTGTKIFSSYQSSFTSKYGYEKGLMSPSEGGQIWNRWFPNEKTEGYNYTPSGYLNDNSKMEILQLVSWFQEIYGVPFISKNLKMSVRIQAIHEIFPDALFIKCHRNPADSAFSILKIRRNKNINWWSVLPKEIESIKSKNEIEQVCDQVYFLDKNINDDLKLFNKSQIINIQYKNLSTNPSSEIDQLFHFFQKNNVLVKRRTNDKQNEVIFSDYSKSKNKDYLKIKKIFENLYSQD